MFVAFSLSISCFAQDFIIFRDGTERSGKIIQVDNDRTLYKAMLYKFLCLKSEVSDNIR